MAVNYSAYSPLQTSVLQHFTSVEARSAAPGTSFQSASTNPASLRPAFLVNRTTGSEDNILSFIHGLFTLVD
jgi:hypothetical protein